MESRQRCALEALRQSGGCPGGVRDIGADGTWRARVEIEYVD